MRRTEVRERCSPSSGSMPAMASPRSFLYTPGDDRGMLAKASASRADAVIADLEDAVVASRKSDALHEVCRWLGARPDDDGSSAQRWVRLEVRGGLWRQQLEQVLPARPDGILVPKAEPALVRGVADVVEDAEHPVAVAALVETARGLRDLDALAATPHLRHLSLGEADLCAELGIERTEGDPQLRPLRMDLVVASAAAGVSPPVASTSTDFRDLEGLRRTTLEARRMGFRGRTAIHPAQVDVINDVFTPSEEEVAAARDVVARLEQASAEGRGAAVDAAGRMIDEAVVRSARRTLALVR